MSESLHCENVTAPGANPKCWLLVLHGLMGAGRNWSVVAKRIVAARPEWGVALVDLPWHGGSAGVPGPYTVERAAAVVRGFIQESGLSCDAMLGHSFGGKVAMRMVRAMSVPTVFIVDSTPSRVTASGQTLRMIEMLERLPGPFASRADAVEAMHRAGIEKAKAQWMAMNLERAGGSLAWRIDPGAMRSLYEDYRGVDLWDDLGRATETRFHFVCAGEDSVVSQVDRDRLSVLGANIVMHTLSGGHWLHVDNPEGVVRTLTENLPE